MARLKEHLFLLGMIVILFLAWYARGKIFLVLKPFLWGVLLALLLVPLAKWLEGKRLSTAWAVGVIYGALLLLLGAFFVFGVPPLWRSIQSFLRDLPSLWETVLQWGEGFPFLKSALAQIGDHAPSFLKIDSAWDALSSAGTRLTQFVVGVVLSAYFLKDRRRVGEEALSLLPAKHSKEAEAVYRQISDVFGAFIRGRFLLSLAVGVLAWLALWLLGVPYAAAFGALFGILDILPFFGPFLAGIPVVAITLSHSVGKAVLVVLVLFAIEEIEALFLQPKLMGTILDIHPASAILAVIAGAAFFGFFGMILAIPLYCAGKILIKRIFSHIV